MTHPLQTLHDKVEAGELEPQDYGRLPVELYALPCSSDNVSDHMGICRAAFKAYRGSLDAAKALHDAVLPGWDVSDMGVNGMLAGHPWGVRLSKWNARYPTKNKTVAAGWGADKYDMEPARAWLLAILRALIEEFETDG